jgi:hypothetical protein
VRKIGDAAFFRIVDRLLEPGTTRVPRTSWSIDGVEWQRERHSYAGTSHGFTVTWRSTSAPPTRWSM